MGRATAGPRVLTPHAGEFARLRAGSGREPDDGRRPVDDDAARATRRPRRRGDVGPGRGPEGREDGDRRAGRRGRGGAVREPGPRDRRHGRRAGRDDRLAPCPGPRAVRRGPRSASTCTASPGDAVRERIGDAGLLASDLPDAIAIARKRLAAVAERRSPGGRLGFGSRGTPDSGRDRGRVRAETDRGRRDAADAGEPIETTARPTPGCRRCHGPPGWSSISTRSPANLALAPRGSCRPGRPRPAGGQGRRLRPRDGPGRPGPGGGRRRRLVRRDPRRGARPARRRGSATDPRPVSDPGRARRRCRPAGGSRSRPATPALLERARSRRGRRRAGAPPTRLELEVETGLGRGGVCRRARRRRRARIRGAPRARLGGLWTHLQAPEDAATARRQIARFEAAAARARQSPACPSRAASRGQRRPPRRGVPRYDGVRPGPVDVRPGAGRARPGRRPADARPPRRAARR